MNLALVLGPQGEKVKPKLSNIKDNLRIDCYMDIPAFIDTSMKRDLVYDRAVILSTVTTDTAIRDLVKFWKKFCMDTEIVFLCREGKDENFAKAIQNAFISTKVAPMLVKSTTLKLFSESVLLTTEAINKKYGVEDYLSVEADVESGVQYYQPDTEGDGDGVSYVPQQEQPKQVEKPKKKGLFGGIFGTRKKPTAPQQSQPQVEEPVEEPEYQEEGDIYDSGFIEDDYAPTEDSYQPTEDSYSPEEDVYETQDYEQPDEEQDLYGDLEQLDAPEENPSSTVFRSETSPFYDEDKHSYATGVGSIEEPDFNDEDVVVTEEDNFGDSTDGEVDSYSQQEPVREQVGYVELKPQKPKPSQNTQFRRTPVKVEEDDSMDDLGFAPIQQEPAREPVQRAQVRHSEPQPRMQNQQVNQRRPSPIRYKEEASDFDEGVEVDFGDTTFIGTSHVSNTIQTPKRSSVEVEDEEEILSSIESQYRGMDSRNQRPSKPAKVQFGGSSALNSIYSGRLHKTIIVTGDRGSGATVTAFSLAKEFAKKVNVLYVDFDIERHGLLSYIDYEFFRTFDESMTDGIKRCRESSIFMNCIIRYDTNIDIITSDYSCDATDDDIQLTHNVVAENVMNYGVVIVDCPISKLHLIQDLIFIGTTIVCMESSKRGVMNMLCGLEGSSLELRYKRCIVHKGMIFATKLNKRISTKSVLQYADSIFASSGCDWLRMECEEFNGTLTKDILSKLAEG